MIKPTWRHFINETSHEFRQFKVYWAYMLYLEGVQNQKKTKKVVIHKTLRLKRKTIMNMTKTEYDYLKFILDLANIFGRNEILTIKNWITWRLENNKPVAYGTIEAHKWRMIADDNIKPTDRIINIMSVIVD